MEYSSIHASLAASGGGKSESQNGLVTHKITARKNTPTVRFSPAERGPRDCRCSSIRSLPDSVRVTSGLFSRSKIHQASGMNIITDGTPIPIHSRHEMEWEF